MHILELPYFENHIMTKALQKPFLLKTDFTNLFLLSVFIFLNIVPFNDTLKLNREC